MRGRPEALGDEDATLRHRTPDSTGTEAVSAEPNAPGGSDRQARKAQRGRPTRPSHGRIRVLGQDRGRSVRRDVSADQPETARAPEHSTTSHDADAAAHEADEAQLLIAEADRCRLGDAEVEVKRQRDGT